MTWHDWQRKAPQKMIFKKNKSKQSTKNLDFCSLVGKRILRKTKPNFSTPKWIAAKWQQRTTEALACWEQWYYKERNFGVEPWNFLKKIISAENHSSSKDVTPLHWVLVNLAFLCSAIHSLVNVSIFTKIQLTSVKGVSSFTARSLALQDTSSCYSVFREALRGAIKTTLRVNYPPRRGLQDPGPTQDPQLDQHMAVFDTGLCWWYVQCADTCRTIPWRPLSWETEEQRFVWGKQW